MAEINIKKSSGSVWGWLIPLLIVVALLLWWLSGRQDNVTTSATETDAVVATGDVAGSSLTDLTGITGAGAASRAELIGQRVALASVPVQGVPADEAFWVGTSDADHLFVVLDPVGVPPGAESPTNVNAGQQVALSGVLRQVPDDLTDMRARWKLSDATASALATASVYLAADRVTVTQTR